ncbi:hypothetical protein Tco_1061739 [Tanacetum coccineum]
MSSSSSSSHTTVTYKSMSNDYHMPSWAPLSPAHALVYPEYVAPSDDDLPAEDQPLLASASPTALSPDYLADSEPVKDDPEEDPEAGPIDYPFEEEEEEEAPLAPTLSASYVPDSVPSSEETEPFEEGETASTPPSPASPHTIVPLSQTRLYRARKTVRPQTPLPASIEARIAEYAAAPTPSSPPPSPLSPLSSPLPRTPSPPLLLPSPTRRDMITEADMTP